MLTKRKNTSPTDVVLIYPELDPDSPWYMERPLMPPVGLAFLAGMLRKHGYRVKVIDNTVEKKSLNELSEIVMLEDPFLVGISSLSVNYQPSIRIANHLKRSSQTSIIVGGPHATVFPETFQIPSIDYICIGEGELTFLELCNVLKDGGNVRSIQGLMYHTQGEWTINEPRVLIKDLDMIPLPAIDLLPMSQYQNKADEISAYPVLSLNTSRGCPFHCTFCSVSSIWHKTYRTFSVDWILNGIEELISKYHAKGIYFYEDNFTLLPQRVNAICDGILRKEYKLKWACEGRIGSLTLPLLKKMKAAGCETIKFGIESGSQRMLDFMKKGISLQEVRESRQLCKTAGIKFACFFLLGIPSETDDDRAKTLQLVKELQPDYLILNTFIPTPRSPLYEKILQEHTYEYMDENYFLYLNEFDHGVLQKAQEDILAVWQEQQNPESHKNQPKTGFLTKALHMKKSLFIKNWLRRIRRNISIGKN